MSKLSTVECLSIRLESGCAHNITNCGMLRRRADSETSLLWAYSDHLRLYINRQPSSQVDPVESYMFLNLVSPATPTLTASSLKQLLSPIFAKQNRRTIANLGFRYHVQLQKYLGVLNRIDNGFILNSLLESSSSQTPPRFQPKYEKHFLLILLVILQDHIQLPASKPNNKSSCVVETVLHGQRNASAQVQRAKTRIFHASFVN